MDNFGQGRLVDILEEEEDDEKMGLIQQEGFHFDINDPREQKLIEKIKDLRSTQQLEKSKEKIMMPLFSVRSIRQELIKLRSVNPDID